MSFIISSDYSFGAGRSNSPKMVQNVSIAQLTFETFMDPDP